MLKTMLELAKMQFKQYNIYKSNFYLFTINRIVEIVVYIFVWQAIYIIKREMQVDIRFHK